MVGVRTWRRVLLIKLDPMWQEPWPCQDRPPGVTWDSGIAIALPDGPDANGGFEIAAVDLSAPLGELQERL